MIIGIGIDTVSIPRIEKLVREKGQPFLRKIFSDAEIGEGLKRRKNAQFFAARFAAREAFVKALGTGFARNVSPRDITVKKGYRGKPALSFSARTQKLLEARGVERCHMSISHDGDYAQAIVILEGA
jgi:holo-[acyl-carrier protein] synthase